MKSTLITDHKGVLYPNSSKINPPNLLRHELNYIVVPKTYLLFKGNSENDTFLAGTNMLSRKSVEVDHVFNELYSNLQENKQRNINRIHT